MALLWSEVEKSADRPDRDGSRRPIMNHNEWCRFVFVCLFARDSENVHGGVIGCLLFT